mmetsp:Transcript_8869/g.21995  ORF Transcript_8869/g.21995 Transcript_8869/m.21995 type:complete len:350 (-) Transcript_8869:58-1107(-)|eukprot:CAMPEP_0173436542 /NCGR_PEP_ID=MMETSP1357-20121228/16359_1 /TAXON_ID=77926 /ORGANISM="Hemiselmis rufescens, Strain PCC563" /LENGTH=349 /DNA_ID=CAMNT_0014401631 /DNA_START=33 /DNA_END=1082 /DNA_ORIENTATION=-
MRGHQGGALLAVLALSLWTGRAASQTLPYSADGITCLDKSILDARIDQSLVSTEHKDAAKEGCRLACQRVKETIESKGVDCERTALHIVELMAMVTGSAAYDDARADEMLKFLIHEHGEASDSCYDDIETHWNNREKHCTPPAYYPTGDDDMTLDKTYDATINAEAKMSVTRRFAFLFMRRKHHGSDGKDKFCMGAMRNILTNPAATAFMSAANGGKCPPVLTSKWDGDSCSNECWAQIQAAAVAAGGPKCCLATYYADMYDFTYRPGAFDSEYSVQLPKNSRGLADECTVDRLPCTYVYDAMLKCESKGGDAKEYNPKECGHSGAQALVASPLLAVCGAVAAVISLLH